MIIAISTSKGLEDLIKSTYIPQEKRFPENSSNYESMENYNSSIILNKLMAIPEVTLANHLFQINSDYLLPLSILIGIDAISRMSFGQGVIATCKEGYELTKNYFK